MSHRQSERGFSIVEALVALAVFAMAGVALVSLQSHSLLTLSEVEARALADIEAQNRLAELIAAREKPDIGGRNEEVRLANRDWLVHVEIAATADLMTQRASITVSAPDGAPLATAHGFYNTETP